MEANCSNCFWWNSKDESKGFCNHANCINANNTYYASHYCSNWQAKNTNNMRCTNCRYSIEIHTTKEEWHFDGVKEIQPEEVSGCLNNTNEFYWSNNAGCVKFWPKD